MNAYSGKGQRILEVFLLLIVGGLIGLLNNVSGHKIFVLNLFFLPVVLAGFFLGRYRAGILTLFCVIAVSIVTVLNLRGFTGVGSPMMLGLGLTIWGAVLGLTSILVGTLSDERNRQLSELHEAHVGVVEVLAKYLQSSNSHLKARSDRIAEWSQLVARQMKFSSQETDNIRVAALLHDMENLEITARVIQKAVGDLGEGQNLSSDQHTFHGEDLVHSLGTVLTGAFPLFLNLNESVDWDENEADPPVVSETPFGARIIRTVRAFDSLLNESGGASRGNPQKAITQLRHDLDGSHHPAVLHALEEVILSSESQSQSQNKQEKEAPIPVGADA